MTMRISEEVKAILRQWGRKGGETRARNLSRGERSRIARKAARARWKKAADALYSFPGEIDLGEIAPKIVGGSMTACAIRESLRRVR